MQIMKSDEDVRMISAEAPVMFAKACEFFILELTMRAWNHAEENKRRTLQRSDVSAAINRTDIFDFLVDIVPKVPHLQHDGKLSSLTLTPRPKPTGGSEARGRGYVVDALGGCSASHGWALDAARTDVLSWHAWVPFPGSGDATTGHGLNGSFIHEWDAGGNARNAGGNARGNDGGNGARVAGFAAGTST